MEGAINHRVVRSIKAMLRKRQRGASKENSQRRGQTTHGGVTAGSGGDKLVAFFNIITA
jgi:hypothetical protein